MESCFTVSKDDEHHGKIFPPKMYNLCSFNENSGKKYLAISTFFHSDEPPLSIYTGNLFTVLKKRLKLYS